MLIGHRRDRQPEQPPAFAKVRQAVGIGQIDHPRFQPLGAMHGEHAHHIPGLILIALGVAGHPVERGDLRQQ